MNKSEFVKKISKKSKMSQKDCKNCIDAMAIVVAQALGNGEKINFVGFGKFEVKYRNSRKLYNPIIKQNMIIPATRIPVFKAGKTLKNAVI